MICKIEIPENADCHKNINPRYVVRFQKNLLVYDDRTAIEYSFKTQLTIIFTNILVE